MNFRRTVRHLLATHWRMRQRFAPAVLDAIETAVHDAESQHSGEIRFVVEKSLDGPALWNDVTPRVRAWQIFGQFGVWDTARNNGVLVYVLFADRAVEILADRGIAERVPAAEWEQICRAIEAHYRQGDFAKGSVAGVHAVGRLLKEHFPASAAGTNELPDRPALL